MKWLSSCEVLFFLSYAINMAYHFPNFFFQTICVLVFKVFYFYVWALLFCLVWQYLTLIGVFSLLYLWTSLLLFFIHPMYFNFFNDFSLLSCYLFRLIKYLLHSILLSVLLFLSIRLFKNYFSVAAFLIYHSPDRINIESVHISLFSTHLHIWQI